MIYLAHVYAPQNLPEYMYQTQCVHEKCVGYKDILPEQIYNLLAKALYRIRGVSTHEYKIEQRIHKHGEELAIAWQNTCRHLHNIKDHALSELGARTIILYVPHLYSLLANESLTEHNLKQCNLPLVSPLGALRDVGDNGSYDNLIVENDGHWNEVAHSIIANELFEYLTKNKFIEKE